MFPTRRITTSGGDVYRDQYSLEFDGTNDYLDCGADSSLDLSDNLTICGWIKTSEANGGYIVAKGNESDSDGYLVIIASSKLRFYNNNTSYLASSASVDDGAWHHFGITYDKSITTRVIYIDGIADTTSTAFSASIGTATENFVIGALSDGTTSNLNGSISEIALWNATLSSNQIKQLYNGKEPFDALNVAKSNLKGYWRMGDGILDARIKHGIIADQVTPQIGTEIHDDGNAANPSASDANGTTGWSVITNGAISSVSDPSIGSYAIRATCDGTGDCHMIYTLDPVLASGTSYKVSFDAKCHSGTETLTIYFSASGSNTVPTVSTTLTTSYQNITFYGTVSASTNRLQMYIAGLSDTEHWTVDNVTIRKISGNPATMVNFSGANFKTDVPR